MKSPLILTALLTLPGCSAVNAVTSVAAMPARAASKAVDAGSTLVDATTTSQSEHDERRGRDIRLQEERLGALDREFRRQLALCDQGSADACVRRDSAWQAIQARRSIQPGLPE